jgi:hypothetical protein
MEVSRGIHPERDSATFRFVNQELTQLPTPYGFYSRTCRIHLINFKLKEISVSMSQNEGAAPINSDQRNQTE